MDKKTEFYIKDKLKNLPTSSGVYLMKDINSEVIYVGKAVNLKNRVSSYFNSNKSKDIKTKVLVSFIKDFEIILTNTETEAFLLERNLIKIHNPKYNILLKDGKEYPYIRINFNETWPRIEKVRKKNDSSFYIGPFSYEGQLNVLLNLVSQIFPTIKCSRQEFLRRKRVCSYFDMKMCLGPCCNKVDREMYLDIIRSASSFLMGKNKEVKDQIKEKMLEYSKNQDYENALKYRDLLFSLDNYETRQYVQTNIQEADLIYVCKEDDICSVEVLNVREGKLIGQESFFFNSFQDKDSILEEFIIQYYESRPLPKELIIEKVTESIENILNIMVDETSTPFKVKLSTSSRGEKAKLIEIAKKNATYYLQEEKRTQYKKKTSLLILEEKFGLKNFPHRIECIDISHFQGTGTVASCVCFIDGVSDKNLYRSYIIKDLEEGDIDDFKSIEEVVRRRILRGIKEDNMFDLLVIDGGKQQLHSAIKGAESAYKKLEEENINIVKPLQELDIISLAKKREAGTFERVFLDKRERPIILECGSSEFKLLTHLRDEAHRFAIGTQRKKRNKSFLHSELTDIPLVAELTAQKLLMHFKSIENIKNASIEDLIGLAHIPRNVAESIKNYFNNKEEIKDKNE